MKIKKPLSLSLIFILLLNLINLNTAAASEKVVYGDDQVQYTQLELSETYGKVKVEYLDTGKIEYIESVIEDGAFVQYILSEDGKQIHKMEIVEETIYLDGEVFGQSVETVDKNSSSISGISLQATKWEYISTTQGNSSWKYANATIIAAALATVMQIPAGAALVLSIAMTFQGLDLNTVYWERYNYADADRDYTTCRRAYNTNFYQYSNYTGFIRSTGIVPASIDPCNSGY
ncbi:hypothetical protein [Bacillus sp. UMB0728]|uniref:hypothetical protein n=1 Tax=Bacillus sp. UMB0728 TaxID=2066052 RepID=UPI000C77769F|nr:hypothetical protein [Bacillus sp. UMB0728]PLR70500.1 hypothetical protein CYJ37_23490 [Bacillus sp. UMB0728]